MGTVDRPRVVLISPYIGHEGVAHAGGRYLRDLQDLLDAETDMTMLTVGNDLNRATALRPGTPRDLLLLGHERGLGLSGRLLNRAVLLVDRWWRRRDPGLPDLPMLLGIARSGRARRAIRQADVLDLQYSESIRLVGLLRRLNRTARITGTFHDVMSQRFERMPRETDDARRFWDRAALRSRRQEARMVRRLDEVLVFSEKDAALLGRRHTVVPPPLSDGSERRHAAAGDSVVVVVSYLARQENHDAARWAMERVWPLVRDACPDATLRFVGGGAREELVEHAGARRSEGVELAGFVDDLEAEYARASVALVPLRRGAGVKFKTVEALCRGVPVVTTTVGAEGIGGDELFARLTDDPAGLAEGIVEVLRDPQGAQGRADRVQDWARTAYSHDRFVETIRRSWSG